MDSRGRRLPAASSATSPPVSELLDVDGEYLEEAASGQLRLIAPRRFNPTGEAWLPVFHTRRATRQYTALFSNTVRAHQAGKTDRVVLELHGGTIAVACPREGGALVSLTLPLRPPMTSVEASAAAVSSPREGTV